MSNTDEQRAAFEAWATAAPRYFDIDTFPFYHLNSPGEYRNTSAQLAWLAWQAAIEHAKKTMCNRN